MPQAKLPQRYDQTLRPPFRVDSTFSDTHIGDLELAEGVDEFVRYGLPPEGDGAVLCDADGVVALGFYRNPVAGVVWYGVKWAVDLLRDHELVDPLTFYTIEFALESK